MKNNVIKLSNGKEMPILGYGTWQNTDPNECIDGVESALKIGYRHIDTAQMYGNEELVGKGIRKSGVPREDIFLTSKLDNKNHGYEKTKYAIDQSLEKLNVDYLDLFLIHWPVVKGHEEDWKQNNIETWRALEEAYEIGKLKAIGLSNFKEEHLKNLLPNSRIKPMVNQLRLHPGVAQKEAVELSREHNIVIEAWSPLSPFTQMKDDERVFEMTKKYGKSIAQLLLKYGIQKDYVVLTKSAHNNRIEENYAIDDFKIGPDEMTYFDNFKMEDDVFM